MLTLQFETANAAFESECPAQCAEVLRAVAKQIMIDGRTSGTIRDVNGNTIGEWNLVNDPLAASVRQSNRNLAR